MDLFTDEKKSPHSLELRPLKEASEIIHIHLFTGDRRAVLFQRANGLWSPISGQVESNESCIDTVVREVWEEAGLLLDRSQISMADHRFSGVSPKGKLIRGKTFWAVLSQTINGCSFKFNGELLSSKVLYIDGAVQVLAKSGLPEARNGLIFLWRNMG